MKEDPPTWKKVLRLARIKGDEVLRLARIKGEKVLRLFRRKVPLPGRRC